MSEQNPEFARRDAPQASTGPADPSDCNLNLEWIETMAKAGFAIVVVQVPYCPELWQKSEVEEVLGELLETAELGFFDSARYGNPTRFFFYVNKRKLQFALGLLKPLLENRGLLAVSTIGYADEQDKVWRQFHPPVAADKN